MREFTVFAPAKLNLYLDVLERRKDGYHNIKTLFEKIDLKDEIIVREKTRGIDIRVEPPTCPSGKDNIVYRALEALFREAKCSLNLEIVIKKKIPVGSGLGGGSSDAASVLRSINENFGLGLSKKRLFSLAVEIGMDIPFFMLDSSFAIGKERGEILEPIETNCQFWHVVIKPDISISTAQMYKRLDGYKEKRKRRDIQDIVLALQKKDLMLLRKSHYNIFEEVLADYSSSVERAKSLLLDLGAGACVLSGSGPSVFSIFKDRGEAVKIKERIPKTKDIEIFVATTYRT